MAEERLRFIIDAQNKAEKTFKEIESGLGRLSNKAKAMAPTFKKMALIGGVAFGAITGTAAFAVKSAGDAEGAWNKFNTVFGEGADDMKKFVTDIRKIMPTATHEIVRMAADLQDLLVPMGIAREEAQGLTKETIELANKIAAFNDVNPAEVLEAMKSGFVGMSEPLRRFGIDARVTSLEATAIREGLMGAEESFNTLDPAIRQSVQAQALMIQMTKQSADAINGFADNQDSFVRRHQEMTASIADTKVAIGNALLPMIDSLLKKILPVIEKMTKWIETNPKLTKVIIIAAGAITGLIAVIGTIGLLLPAIITGFTLLAGPIGLVIIAVMALVTAGVLLWRNWDSISRRFKLMWQGIQINIELKILRIKQAFRRMADFFYEIWERIKNIFRSAIDWIEGKIQPLIDLTGKVKGMAGNVAETVKSKISRLFGGGQFGIPEVPRTGTYLLHRGEQVVPAGARMGGGITVNINGGMYLSERAAEEIGNMIVNKLKRNLRI